MRSDVLSSAARLARWAARSRATRCCGVSDAGAGCGGCEGREVGLFCFSDGGEELNEGEEEKEGVVDVNRVKVSVGGLRDIMFRLVCYAT